MERGTKIVLVASIALSLIVSSSIIFISSNRIFAQEEKTDQSLFLVNEYRTQRGLKDLSWNSKLERAAEEKANDIFEKGYFDHTAPDGTKVWSYILDSGYSYKFVGENLAADFDSVDKAFSAWVESPTHLSNITSEKYTDYALFQKEGTLDGKNIIVFVQLFGAL
jgi:uncharacterized protein YkwD